MEYPAKELLLRSIVPGMKLDKAFFLKIYGCEVSYPGFSETAIKALEDAGCSRARSYYNQIVNEYERNQDEKIRPVASWLREQVDKKYERLCGGGERNADGGKAKFSDGLPQDW